MPKSEALAEVGEDAADGHRQPGRCDPVPQNPVVAIEEAAKNKEELSKNLDNFRPLVSNIRERRARIKEKPVKDAYKKTVVVLNTAGNIWLRLGGEVNRRAETD